MPRHMRPQGVSTKEPLLADSTLMRFLLEVRLSVPVEEGFS